MQRLQSRAARLALGWKMINLSLTKGLNWLNVPKMAAEATIREDNKSKNARKFER